MILKRQLKYPTFLPVVAWETQGSAGGSACECCGVGMVPLEPLNKANIASYPLHTFNIFQRCVGALTAIFISKCLHLVSSMHKILALTPCSSLLEMEFPRAAC